MPEIIRSYVPLTNSYPDVKQINDCITSISNVIGKLKTDLKEGTWDNKDYAHYDLTLMPSMVRAANHKYPDMNLTFVKSVEELVDLISEAKANNQNAGRYIINMGEDGVHFAVVDCRIIDGKTSVMLFEPSRFSGQGPIFLALRVKSELDNHLQDSTFFMVEMNLQGSKSECGIYSLSIAKKLHVEKEQLDALHVKNLSGELSEGCEFIPCKTLDEFLPIKLYKHVQGTHRLEAYIQNNPEAETCIVNKKNETLRDRFYNNTLLVGGHPKSISIYNKRITEYETIKTRLLNSLRNY